MRLILSAAILISLASCGIIKPQTIYITKDSVITVTNTVYRDTIIHLPGDTVTIELPAKVDTVYIARSGKASATVAISKGKVKVISNCDEQNLIITRLQEQLHHYETASSDSVQTTIKTVKHIPGFYQFTFWGFFVLAALITTLLLTNNNIWVLLIGTLGGIFKQAAKRQK